jgi:hypothetical protein
MVEYNDEGVKKPKNKFEEVGGEFLNEAEYEEALDEEYEDPEEQEKEEYDYERKVSSNPQRELPEERDEDIFEKLKNSGHSEEESANVTDAVKEKQLREREYRKGKFKK